MIEIRVNNTNLLLAADTQLRFELNSPLFETNTIPGSKVYPFNIPVKGNAEVFNFAHVVSSNKKREVRKIDCQLFFAGYQIFSGKLLLSKADSKNYTASIVVEAFAVDFSNMNLPELLVGVETETDDIREFANTAIENEYPDTNYNFPEVHAEKFYGDENAYNPDFSGFINKYDGADQEFWKNEIHEDPEPDNINTLVPFPYLLYVIKKLFENQNYQAFGNLFSHEELQKLIVFNNYPLDLKQKEFYVRASLTNIQIVANLGSAIFKAIEYDNDSTGINEDNDNCYNTNLYRYQIQEIGYHELKAYTRIENMDIGNSITAVFVLWDGVTGAWADTINELGGVEDKITFIESELTEHNYIFYANESNIGSYIYYKMIEGVLENTYFEIHEAFISISNTSISNFNRFSNTIRLKNHVPKITAGSFINAIKDLFCLGVFFDLNRKQIRFSFRKDIVKSSQHIDLTDYLIVQNRADEGFQTELFDEKLFSLKYSINSENSDKDFSDYETLIEVPSWRDLPIITEPNHIAIVTSSNTAYISQIDSETNESYWAEFSHNFIDVNNGDESEEIAPDVSPMLMKDYQTPNNPNVLYGIYPQTDATASSQAFETGTNDFSFNLFFYRGRRTNQSGENVPFATSLRYNYVGNEIGNLTLKQEDIWNEFHNDWADFMRYAEDVTVKLRITVLQFVEILKLFSAQESKPEVRKVRIQSTNYIPKRFSFILSNSGIRECEAVLVKQGDIEV